jgi:NADH-quinone oxidoreductase subunit E
VTNRRLAPDHLQPASFQFSPESEDWALRQIGKYPEGRQASAIVPLLWQVQGQCGGWLPQKAMEAVADRLGMPYIRVLEVATFYTMFNLEPIGKYFVQLCGTTPCGLRGANDLKAVLRERIGDEGDISADGNFTWQEVECLGACCNAPMVQIENDYYEDLTPEILARLMEDLAAGREPKAGSQQGRKASEPAGAVNTLQDPALFDGSMIGAWRHRFEDETPQHVQAEQRAEAEAASTTARAAMEPRVAKPDAGRAIERPAVDAPAQRAAANEEPQREPERSNMADPSRATVAAAGERPEGRPAPDGDKSYTATPSKPEEGRPVAAAPESRATDPAQATIAEARTGRVLPEVPPEGPPSYQPGTTPPEGGADAEAVARAEEAVVAAALVVLPKGASAEERAKAVGSRPAGLEAPRGATPDDLKRIRGIGPGNEGKLNGLGIYHYDQIAAWGRAEVRWVGTYLGFPGRIDRERWVEQAKGLAG